MLIAKGERFYGRVYAASLGYGRRRHWDVCAGDDGWENGECGMASSTPKKGDPCMMDCFMAGILSVGFVLIRLLVNWCQRQVDSQE